MPRRSVLALALALAALAPPPGGLAAGPVREPLALLPAEARSRVEEARHLVGSMREAIGDGFASATGALLAAGGREVTAAPALPAPSDGDLARTASLPPRVRGAVAGLAAAVREAAGLLGRMPVGQARRALRAVTRSLRANTVPVGFGGLAVRERPASPPIPAALERAAGRTPRAAQLVAAALDRYLPAIESWSASASGDGDGCDLVDEVPYLCVGSPADNTYTEEVALLIDQAGNDTYLIPAGAAPFHPEGEPDVFAVSVNIDRKGDDRYVAGPISGLTDAPSGQGYGALGGVGVLVDVEGSDDYSAAARPLTPALTASGAYAQGVGLAAGYGALFDLEGDDRYSVLGTDGRGDVFVLGQGIGYLYAGAGGVVDLGGGADAYALDAGRAEGTAKPRGFGQFSIKPVHQVQGQGQAYIGAGVVHDDGGTDAFRATASARGDGGGFMLDPEKEPDPQLPGAVIWAQATGIFGGVGLLLEGEGDTRYDVEAIGEGIVQSSLLVQGLGFLAGAGAVDDLGGDDSYSARAVATDVRDVVVEDSCACPFARARVTGLVSGVSAQGWGAAAGGIGLVRDGGGDDAYAAANLHTVRAALRDELTSPATAPSLDLFVWPPPIQAQGFGTADAVGVLLDEGGSDDYSLLSFVDAAAEASSERAAGDPSVSGLVLPRLYALAGQGASRRVNDAAHGSLFDLGGSGDRFAARAGSRLQTAPDPEGARTVGFLWPPFQGSGDGGLFAALGDRPEIVSSPSQGVCAASTGFRGYGSWAECAATTADPDRQVFDFASQVVTQTPEAERLSHGLAPRAGGRAPSLAFTADTPATGPGAGRIAVAARLLDPDGKPMAGASVRFDLQFALRGPGLPVERAWFNGWEVDVETDAGGVARARLPIDVEMLSEISGGAPFTPDNLDYRLMATYDGSGGELYPRHAMLAFEVAR